MSLSRLKAFSSNGSGEKHEFRKFDENSTEKGVFGEDYWDNVLMFQNQRYRGLQCSAVVVPEDGNYVRVRGLPEKISRGDLKAVLHPKR